MTAAVLDLIHGHRVCIIICDITIIVNAIVNVALVKKHMVFINCFTVIVACLYLFRE